MFLKLFEKLKYVHGIRLFRNFHKSRPSCIFLSDSRNAIINKSAYDRYMCLPIPDGKIQATYIWIDNTGIDMKSKTRTLKVMPTNYKEVPQWTFNGAATGQAKDTDSECYLVPVALYRDPIRRGHNKLVLCEVFNANEKPSETNHRQKCVEILNKNCEHELLFKFEQEYMMIGHNRSVMIEGDPIHDTHSTHCGVGARQLFGREVQECFYRACLYCDIEIANDKPEMVKGQWEFKIGPTANIKAADDLWLCRWLLLRISEDFGVEISFSPKISKRLPGSGLHMGVSTKQMREEGGYKHIEEAIKKLEKNHKEDLKMFDPVGGTDNARRLLGAYLAPNKQSFNFGVADRSASIRIPKIVAIQKRGAFEDRRPGASADPYLVIATIVKSLMNAC